MQIATSVPLFLLLFAGTYVVMATILVIIGLGVRVIMGAVRRGRVRRPRDAGAAQPAAQPDE